MSDITIGQATSFIILAMFNGEVPAVGQSHSVVITDEVMRRIGSMEGIELVMLYDHATMTTRLEVRNHGVPDPREMLDQYTRRGITSGL